MTDPTPSVSAMKVDVQRLRDLLSRATPGPWAQEHRKSGDGYSTEVFDAAGKTIASMAWHAKPPRYEDGRKIVSTDRPDNAELIAAAINALPELLAIAEAYNAAPVGAATAAAGSDGGTWLECDDLSQDALDNLNGQTVRLVRVVGDTQTGEA